MKNAIISWSGGKDSARAVYEITKNEAWEVKGLLSTTSLSTGRLPMHEVKRSLLRAQADSLGMPLYEVKLPMEVGNDMYEQMLNKQFARFKEQGIHTIVYADLFLEDIKKYRDLLLFHAEMEGAYPLWKWDTAVLARDFIAKGFKAIVTTVDKTVLPAEWAGSLFDETFLDALPEEVDPCGENGEFHTFVFDGPNFDHPISVEPGKRFTTMEGRFEHAELNEK